MRRRLLDMIHRFYLDAISRLPPAEFRRTTGLARGLFIGGHCFGPLHPVHNIVVNSIWYGAAFPVRRPAGSDDEDEANALLSTDGIARICHRSLDGLVAALRDLCPSLSNGDALWRLFSTSADLTAAVALANGVSKSSALRVVAPQGHAAFHLAALVAQHPDPTAFAHFASSALPSINGQHNIVQLLLMKHALATRHINYLSKVLVPSSPNGPSVAPLMLSAQVLDCIASQRQQFKGIGKQVVNVVNMALQEYTQRSGEQLTLHSVCGASLLKEEGLKNCYHINFLACHVGSGSGVGAPVLFFTEAIILSCDETDISLCVPVDPVTDIGCCFACESNRKKVVHPFYDEYLGGREFQEDEVDYGNDFPSPLDVDYIFFYADRDRAFANYLWRETTDR
ncbi:unnamed protein product [Miscanthus lutarioriparius]|uniref:Uncharacterized protein n=1 Tax=Miscanthus lutarioriparius TaxID=422564 RepID=A0A811QPB9_9POAL|nr:unnamed protein product [Miscanthus lutarioriparius]